MIGYRDAKYYVSTQQYRRDAILRVSFFVHVGTGGSC